MTKIEIYDCTLREGEQAAGVSFTLSERIEIVKALNDIGVDYIELGWPLSKEVLQAFLEIKKLKLKSKIVAFGSTSLAEDVKEDKNLEAIVKSRADYACIFGKSWLEHVEKQLKITPEDNLKKISDSVKFLRQKGLNVFYDAEHYFDAFKDNKVYTLKTLDAAQKAGASRIILCDTNGGTMPHEIRKIIRETKEYFKKKKMGIKLGVHLHNDCNLALSNSLEASEYVKQIQGTINGIGERVGNLDLCVLLPILVLKMGIDLKIKINKLKSLSELVNKAANLPSQITQAFVSPRAFTHKGGVHIDATRKGASYEHVSPQAFGLNHELILSSLGGSACVISAAEKFGYKLDKDDSDTKAKIKNVLEEIAVIEKRGYDMGNLKAEQFILIEKNFGEFKRYFSIKKWKISTEQKVSECYVKAEVNGDLLEIKKKVSGGPVDAAYKAMSGLIAIKYPEVKKIKLVDYKVRIAKSLGVESSVRTRIDFSDHEKFSTVGISENIIQSSIEALEKGFNYYLNKNKHKIYKSKGFFSS